MKNTAPINELELFNDLEERVYSLEQNMISLAKIVSEICQYVGINKSDTCVKFKYDSINGCVRVPNKTIKEKISNLYDRVDSLNMHVNTHLLKLHSPTMK